MMFAVNPELWQELYGQPEAGVSDSGLIIREPATEEDLEEMLHEWEDAGWTPPV